MDNYRKNSVKLLKQITETNNNVIFYTEFDSYFDINDIVYIMVSDITSKEYTSLDSSFLLKGFKLLDKKGNKLTLDLKFDYLANLLGGVELLTDCFISRVCISDSSTINSGILNGCVLKESIIQPTISSELIWKQGILVNIYYDIDNVTFGDKTSNNWVLKTEIDSDFRSYYTKNNNGIGLSKINPVSSGSNQFSLLNCNINSGSFTKCDITSNNINKNSISGGELNDCNVINNYTVSGGIINNTTVNSGNTWKGGIWNNKSTDSEFDFTIPTWVDGTFLNGKLSGSTIQGGRFVGGVLSGTTGSGVNILQFDGGTLSGSTFTGGTYNNCTLEITNVSGGTFYNSSIYGGNLIDCYFENSKLYGVNVSGGTFNMGLISGGTVYNQTIESGSVYSVDLSNVIFKDGIVSDCEWTNSDFYGGIMMNDSRWWSGHMYNGIFQNSAFKSGIVYYGHFKNGSTFETGIFKNGIMEDSTVNSVEWYDGIAYSSTFVGNTINWYNGQFNYGTFSGGTWYDGIFYNGTFDATWTKGNFYNGIDLTNSIDSIYLMDKIYEPFKLGGIKS